MRTSRRLGRASFIAFVLAVLLFYGQNHTVLPIHTRPEPSREHEPMPRLPLLTRAGAQLHNRSGGEAKDSGGGRRRRRTCATATTAVAIDSSTSESTGATARCRAASSAGGGLWHCLDLGGALGLWPRPCLLAPLHATRTLGASERDRLRWPSTWTRLPCTSTLSGLTSAQRSPERAVIRYAARQLYSSAWRLLFCPCCSLRVVPCRAAGRPRSPVRSGAGRPSAKCHAPVPVPVAGAIQRLQQ